MDELVDRVRRAVGDRDTVSLQLLLHPYLHWTEPEVKLRGRSNVLTHLAAVDSVNEPTSYELRDGQIYRWTRT
jgi:hypothetical protein